MPFIKEYSCISFNPWPTSAKTPWHGLGNQLAPNQPIEVWAEQRRHELDHRSRRSPLRRRLVGQSRLDPRVSRTEGALSLGHQSAAVGRLVPLSGGSTARDPGVLSRSHRGRRLRAGDCRRAQRTARSSGHSPRPVSPSLLKGKDTRQRLSAARHRLRRHAGDHSAIHVCKRRLQQHARRLRWATAPAPSRCRTASQFDAQAVKRQLGIAISSWDGFMARMKALAERKVSDAVGREHSSGACSPTRPTSAEHAGRRRPTTRDQGGATHCTPASGKGATLARRPARHGGC